MNRDNFYINLRIAGAVSLIPFILFFGPFTGYLVADFLKQKFHISDYWYYILCGIGLLSGIFEVVRIVKFVLRQQIKEK